MSPLQNWDRIAGRLEARVDELVERMLERVWANPALEAWSREEVRGTASDVARPTIAREIEALRRRELPQSCPEQDLDVARAAVAYGAPVVVPLHCYRAGQAALGEAWLEEVERLELPADERTALLRDGATFMNQYVDRCSAWVELEYERERERVIRSEEQRRMTAVRDLLDGHVPSEGSLNYDLKGRHVALVLWGRTADTALSAVTNLTSPEALAVSVDPQTWWIWFAFGAEDPADPLVDWEPPAGVRVAVGGPADGIEGFRRAHHEARDADRIASYQEAAVVRYSEIALEALAAQDTTRAREFVVHELGPLLGDGPRERRLLATLEAYFLASQNASSAAARLGVHERTVSNRLRAIETRLGGRPVDARRAELEVALRVRRLLSLPPAAVTGG